MWGVVLIMNILDQINKYKSYGFVFIPTNGKKPKGKFNGNYGKSGEKLFEWKDVNFIDDDFLSADGAGIDHKRSNIVDIDIDNNNALKFTHLLPDTFSFASPKTDGKIANHFIYKVGCRAKPNKYLSDRHDPSSTIIDFLASTQSVLVGENRNVINDVEPALLDEYQYKDLQKTVGMISLLTMLDASYPADGSRNNFVLAVLGSLARHSKLNYDDKVIIVEELCKANHDEDVRERLKQIDYIDKQIDKKENVWGIPELSKQIGKDKAIVGNWFNWVDDEKLRKTTPITAMGLFDFINKSYPPAEYLLYPIVPKGSIVQVFGQEGRGKTQFSTGLAFAISQGKDFLNYKNHSAKKTPVLIVDGEMPENELQERYCSAAQSYGDSFDPHYIKVATIGEQLNDGYDPINEEFGQERIELVLEQMSESFGQRPLVILDNLTYLTTIQEKDGVEFLSMMKWFIKLRKNGYSIVFIHHATKEGSTSSGSNVKERPIDVNIKITTPEEADRIANNETQMFIELAKIRRWCEPELKNKFIASLSRHTGAWTAHSYQKRTKGEIAFDYWFNTMGKENYLPEMNAKDAEFKISKTTFQEYKKQHLSKEKTDGKNKDEHDHF